MNYAQKSGTNAPLRGASVELGVENGKWKMENGGVVAVGDSTILHSTKISFKIKGKMQDNNAQKVHGWCKRK